MNRRKKPLWWRAALKFGNRMDTQKAPTKANFLSPSDFYFSQKRKRTTNQKDQIFPQLTKCPVTKRPPKNLGNWTLAQFFGLWVPPILFVLLKIQYTAKLHCNHEAKRCLARLELRQYKNDSIWSKEKLALNLPRFFTRLYRQFQD